MQRRRHSFLGRLLALLLMAQSLLPVTALASVKVRCVGAPLSAKPCVQALVPVSDTASAQTMRAGMACCRTMMACRSMMGHQAMPVAAPGDPAPHRAVFSALSCLVSVTPVCTKQAAVVPHSQQWLLHSAPAQAPPVTNLVPLALSRLSAIPSQRSFSLPPLFITHAHGLRAPPCV